MSSRAASSGEQHQKRRMALAVALDQVLYGKKPFAPTPLQKSLQVFFNLIGIAVGCICLRWGPTKLANRLTAIFTDLKSKRPPPPMDGASQNNIENILKLTAHSKNDLLKNPAIFFITSHPETSNEEAYRLGDLVYHAVKTSDHCFPKKYMKVLQAIDPFALDTLPWWMGGAYAGFVFSGFIAVDRMPGTGTFLQNALFRKAHFKYAIFHILRSLNSGNPLCAALGGGVIHNTRILYVFREFAQQIYFGADRKLFSKREIETRVEAILSAENCKAATTGKISGPQALELLKLMNEVHIPKAEAEKHLNDLREESALSTPYRFRFLKVLVRRLAQNKKPLLLVPFMDRPSGAICVNEPVLILGYQTSRNWVSFVKWSDDKAEKKEMEIYEFVKKFVKEELNEL